MRGTGWVWCAVLACMWVLVLAGCGRQGEGVESGQRTDTAASQAEEAQTDRALVDGRWVQDLWLYEGLSTFDADGGQTDLLGYILDNLPGDPEPAVELAHGARFIVYPALRPWLSDGEGKRRQDVDVVAGILSTPEGEGLAVLATPTADATDPVGMSDSVEIDLTFLGERLSPGDVITADIAFLQALAGPDPEGATGLEVLRHRMLNDRIRYFGEQVDGESEPLVYQAVLGMAVAGSTRSRLPGKSDPMMDGFRKGLSGCRGGLRCVRKFFKKFGGARGSQELIDCNLSYTCSPRPTPPPPVCRFRCGSASGDPHVMTFDHVDLSMQAVGEFIAARTSGLEVQIRTAAVGSSTTVSYVTGIALQAGAVRMVFEADAAEPRVWVDGQPADMPESPEGQAGTLAGLAVTRFPTAIALTTPEQHRVVVSNLGRSTLVLMVDLAEGTETAGMFGNNNGDRGDDLQTRDGRILPADVGHDDFYGVFVASWRVKDDESLFEYGPGESTASFTNLAFPERRLTLDTLPPGDVARARAICVHAGITDPHQLDACTFDLAVSGDMEFVRAAMYAAMLAGDPGRGGKGATDPAGGATPVGPQPDADGSGATLELAANGAAGASVLVAWTGPGGADDYISVASPGDPQDRYINYTRTSEGSPLKLRLPPDAGTWEVRYVQRQGNRVLARRLINVEAQEATLGIPDTAAAGSRIQVEWTGPDHPDDFIAVAEVGEAGDRYVNYIRTSEGAPLWLLLPPDAGTWEVRYVQRQGYRVLARQTIDTTKVEASLDAPEREVAGARVLVNWAGPDYGNDFISVAAVGDPGDRYVNYTRTAEGAPLRLLLPPDAGTWEVRYVQRQGYRVLARHTVTTTEPEAGLEIPDREAAGARMLVNWTGPDYGNDFISVAAVGDPGDRYVNYTRTAEGAPLRLLLPAEPGTWEVRYVQRQGYRILARQTITTTAVQASVDGPSAGVAGTEILVSWTGPDYDADFISVATPDAAGDAGIGHVRTAHGSPLRIKLPMEPGRYELRYVQRQSYRILARREITVQPAP